MAKTRNREMLPSRGFWLGPLGLFRPLSALEGNSGKGGREWGGRDKGGLRVIAPVFEAGLGWLLLSPAVTSMQPGAMWC